MRGFIGRWLSDSIRFGLGLLLALAALQVPALTNAYTAALLQISGDARRDIDQREDVARQYYRWTDKTTDAAVIESLRPVEPANAEGLAASVAREVVLRGTYTRLMETPALIRPLSAAWDVLIDDRGAKRAVLATAVDSHVPQVTLSLAAAIYGLAGLMLGLLLAQLLISLPGRRHGPAAMATARAVPAEPLRRRPTLGA
jgi:hypothetical protein